MSLFEVFLATSKRILVLSGAGVSTSCGIPDFRSANGIYATLEQSRPELYDPQMMFDINVFKEDPSIFYSFAKELYPSNFKPSPSHRFIKLLEEKGKLLRNYSAFSYVSSILIILIRLLSSPKYRHVRTPCWSEECAKLPWSALAPPLH